MSIQIAMLAFGIGLKEALKLFVSLKKTQVPQQLAASALAVIKATESVVAEAAKRAR